MLEGNAVLEKPRLIELFGDDPDTISSMVSIYLESQTELIEELTIALANDPEVHEIRLLAHTIKCSVSNFGADALSELGAKMEDACKANNLQNVIDTFPLIQTLSRRTNDAMKRHMAEE